MLATLKQQGLIDPDIFISQSNELTEQLRAVKLKKERLLTVDGDNTIAQTRELMEILNDGPDFLDSWYPDCWKPIRSCLHHLCISGPSHPSSKR